MQDQRPVCRARRPGWPDLIVQTDFDDHAVRGLEITQVVILLKCAFPIENQEGSAIIEWKGACVPGAAMQFECTRPVYQKRRQPLQIKCRLISARRRYNKNRPAPPSGAKTCSVRRWRPRKSRLISRASTV